MEIIFIAAVCLLFGHAKLAEDRQFKVQKHYDNYHLEAQREEAEVRKALERAKRYRVD